MPFQVHEGRLAPNSNSVVQPNLSRHPNILLFMGVCFSNDDIIVVTELLENGSLFDVIHDESIELANEEVCLGNGQCHCKESGCNSHWTDSLLIPVDS